METRTPSEVRRILVERAAALAVAPASEADEERMQVVPLAIDGEVYGIDALQVLEIQPVGRLVRVPSTPEFVAGVMNVRGRIHSILHLRRFLGLPNAASGRYSKVALVSAGLTLGILADEVSDLRRVRLGDLGPAPIALTGVSEEYVRGVTPDLIVVLNLEGILADSRLIVSADEVG